MDVALKSDWGNVLCEEFEKNYFKELCYFVKKERGEHLVYPPEKLVFNAFEKCPFSKVKIVILGQDPYHGEGQANGLSFSVAENLPFPPSLRNIFKELNDDLGVSQPSNGNLERWAEQGVLMLNSTLTVRSGAAGSHQGKGWQEFTDSVIRILNDRKLNLVFVLWGAYAQSKADMISSQKHRVLKSRHPSPFSAYRGFYGSKPFSKVNDYLKLKDIDGIIW